MTRKKRLRLRKRVPLLRMQQLVLCSVYGSSVSLLFLCLFVTNQIDEFALLQSSSQFFKNFFLVYIFKNRNATKQQKMRREKTSPTTESRKSVSYNG